MSGRRRAGGGRSGAGGGVHRRRERGVRMRVIFAGVQNVRRVLGAGEGSLGNKNPVPRRCDARRFVPEVRVRVGRDAGHRSSC